MKDEDKQLLGKCLLAVGGAVLIGAIVDAWTEEEGSSRETLNDSKTKALKQKSTRKSSLSTNDIKSTKRILDQVEKTNQPNRFLVKVPKVDRFKKEPESILQLQPEDRKYPNHYYSLSKAQQYKFRKKLANQLFQISQERK